MKGIAALAHSGIQIVHLFLILSYTISALFLFSKIFGVKPPSFRSYCYP